MNFSPKPIRIAILDLYEGVENQGMRCIRNIINEWKEINQLDVSFDEFEVRIEKQVPDLSYDIYVSTGGPGSPLESEGSEWENVYFNWLENLLTFNRNPENPAKKKVFFICHSFQLACRYFKVGNVCKRKSTAFGVFPIHKTQDGSREHVFGELKDPIYGVDSRDYQVIEPNHSILKEFGGRILAIEKERPHVPLERAIMAIRFSDNLIGTQFHPEADAVGMSMYLQREDKKTTIIENYGQPKWENMINHLEDPNKILLTNRVILPNFLNQAAGIMAEV